MILIAPPVQSRVQNVIPAIVSQIDSIQPDFWKQHYDVFREESASSFWDRERHFIQLEESTRHAEAFKRGWDGSDAPAPNDGSVTRTLEVLSSIRDSNLSPYSVLPSANGGVGISFRGNGNKRAVLELLNDGTAVCMLFGKGHPIVSSEFSLEKDLQEVLRRLEEYL